MFEIEDFTTRNVAQYVVYTVIATKVGEIAKNAITDYTRFEKDEMIVKVSGNVIGWGVASRLKPYTDKVVDKTADFVSAKREEMKTKKENKKETPEEK